MPVVALAVPLSVAAGAFPRRVERLAAWLVELHPIALPIAWLVAHGFVAHGIVVARLPRGRERLARLVTSTAAALAAVPAVGPAVPVHRRGGTGHRAVVLAIVAPWIFGASLPRRAAVFITGAVLVAGVAARFAPLGGLAVTFRRSVVPFGVPFRAPVRRWSGVSLLVSVGRTITRPLERPFGATRGIAVAVVFARGTPLVLALARARLADTALPIVTAGLAVRISR